MSRVLSTEQAKSAINQVQSIINGGFTDQISALDAQGKILSDPNTWDGPLAAQFRGSTWPDTKAALDKARQDMAKGGWKDLDPADVVIMPDGGYTTLDHR